jgi:hypothetical protein
MVVFFVIGVRVTRAAVGGASVSGRAMGFFVGVRSMLLAVALSSRMSRGRRVVVVRWAAAAVAAYRRRRNGRLVAAWRSCVGALDGWRAVVGAARMAIVDVVVVVVAVVCVVPIAPRSRLDAVSRVSAHRRPAGAVPPTAIVRIRVVGGHGYGW